MHRRFLLLAPLASLALVAVTAGAALAVKPDTERDSYTDRFHDDFIFDLCGIDTWTTITERWTLKTYPDGSQTFQDVRTFVPDDLRIPIEKGAGTGRFAADGTQTVTGKPLQLIYRDGRHGLLIRDAGRVTFDPNGDVISMRGPHPSLDLDLAELYCP